MASSSSRCHFKRKTLSQAIRSTWQREAQMNSMSDHESWRRIWLREKLGFEISTMEIVGTTEIPITCTQRLKARRDDFLYM